MTLYPPKKQNLISDKELQYGRKIMRIGKSKDKQKMRPSMQMRKKCKKGHNGQMDGHF